MVTFTLPKELRETAWRNQKIFYNLMFECSKETLQTFTKNDKKLGGTAGLMSVLHTHARNLDYHPHVHIIIVAASINQKTKTWKTKDSKYLFNHKALAKVFRAKILSKLNLLNIKPSPNTRKWIVDCKHVGKGDKAIVYLGRYLYRGVIREKDIIDCKNGKVTYRYQNSKTKKHQYKTVTGEYFLYLIMQHILPKGFRRARNYGFVHPNCKRMIALIHYILKFIPTIFEPKKRTEILCKCCGAVMEIVRTQIKRSLVFDLVPI
jgi:hemoglobin-like flavoprotein